MKARSFAALSPVFLLAASIAAAQQPTATAAQQPTATQPPRTVAPPPTPPIGPAALTVPNPLSGLQPGPRDLFQSPDGSDRFQHISRHPSRPPRFFFPGAVLPGPFFPGPYYVPAPVEPPPTARLLGVPRGGLMIEAEPDFAQVFVDGFYMGLAGEFGLRGRALDLTFGAHRVELRAAGYETLAFNVMIEANRILRYRGDLQPLAEPSPRPPAAAPAAAPQPGARKNLYVIPNCYAGDKPPEAALPQGCDIAQMKVRTNN